MWNSHQGKERSANVKMEKRGNEDRSETIKGSERELGMGGERRVPKWTGKKFRGSGSFRHLIQRFEGRTIHLLLEFETCPFR